MPHGFTCQDPPPRLLSARVVRHPITPLARIWSAQIRNTANANALLEDAEADWTCGDFEEVYTEEDLRVIKDSYAEIPAGIRPLLLGNVMHEVMMQAAFWTKCEAIAALPQLSSTHDHPLFLHFTVKELRAAACSVSRILIQLERMEETEVRLSTYTSWLCQCSHHTT